MSSSAAADKSPGGGGRPSNAGANNPVFPVGPAGRRELRRALVRSTNPGDTISQFQESHSLHSMMARAFGTTPKHEALAEAEKTKTRSKSKDDDTGMGKIQVETLETDPALAFLSQLGVSRHEVHKRVGDTLLKHLEVEIKKTKSQEPLLTLLKQCWAYSTTIPELRPVLWAVLKQLGKDTPPAVLKALGEQDEKGELKHADIFRPLPPLLKRLVWETDWEDKVTSEMAEEMDPKTFLEHSKTTLLGHTILPHLKEYCHNEYLTKHASRTFVVGHELRIPTTQRRALTAISQTTATAANPAASGSTSPKASSGTSTLSSLTNRAATGAGGKSGNVDEGGHNSVFGKAVASIRQLLSDPTGGTAAFRPKLLYAVLSMLIAQHGSLDDNILGGADHLHCTLVADILMSASTGLPKAYHHVFGLARVLDDSVSKGVLQDVALLNIQKFLKEIFPALPEAGKSDGHTDNGKDGNKKSPTKNKKDKKEAAANVPKVTPGKTANDPIHEPTTAFKRQLSRIIHGCLDAMKEADPQSLFLNPVTDAIAPGYSKVISKPMCIMAMREKVDSDEYKTLKEFEEDVKLMFQNCITYNRGAPGQWFRGEAQRQRKVFKEEVLPQARKIYEKEVALRTKKEDEEMVRKRKQPGDDEPIAKGKPGTASSKLQPIPSAFKNAAPEATKPPAAADGDKKNSSKDKVYPSMQALASMLLADPFVVRLVLARLLRSVRYDVVKGKSLPIGTNVMPSLLQILSMAQWSNQVCAVRGRQYVVPDGGTDAPPEQDDPSAKDILTKILPYETLRRYLPLLSQLLLENALDQRVVVRGDLYDAYNSMKEARPPPPDPKRWTAVSQSNLQGVVALVQGTLIWNCLPGNANETSLAVTYEKYAAVLQEASPNICEDRPFFLGLNDALLKHKNKLRHSTRDVVVKHWLDYLRRPPRHAKRKKGPKKQKKWGTSTSAAHECLVMLLNEWSKLGNQLLPRDKLLEFSSDAMKAAQESETLEERKFVALWKESLQPKKDEIVGDFAPVRKQYERMLESLPENSRSQWKEQAGLVDDEMAGVKEENGENGTDEKDEEMVAVGVKEEPKDDEEMQEATPVKMEDD